jgi:hypothetical protein
MFQQNNENNSEVLILETLNTNYKNLLIAYKLAVSNYVDYLKQEVKQPSKEMVSITGAAFWGTSSLSETNSQTLEECKASCMKLSNCSGATYNLTNGTSKCMLRKGNGNIIGGSQNDVAIVIKGQQLLKIVENINDELTKVNNQIQTLTTPTVKQMFNLKSNEIKEENKVLIGQYNNLIGERDKMQNMLNEYQSLDAKEIEGSIHISQNYYSFILLMVIAILFIFMLYKLYIIPSTQSTTFVQNEGQLDSSAYYIVFGIVLLILLITSYDKYKLL